MFFQSRQTKQAKQLLQAAGKLLNYREDILSESQRESLKSGIADLKETLLSHDKKKTQTAMEALDAVCTKIAPPDKNSGWRENCEVILVAITIAIGVRAYFLQPFKIPTGSMQPTLNGVIGTPSIQPSPGVIQQVAEYLWLGRNYVNLVSESDNNTVLELHEIKRARFFIFTKLVMTGGTHTVYAPPATLVYHFGVRPGRTYAKGEPIVQGHVDTGDQVFVDKMSLNFRPPKRGEVFVFKTTGIKRIEQTLNPAFGSQYYIKRLAGLPGDTLQIKPPQLFVNGELAKESTFHRVMNAQDGYNGYSNNSRDGDNNGPPFFYLGHPDDIFEIPEHAYFALGDNSFNSSDSRHWGIVPERNIVGRGLFVYWPFSKHWGLIR